LEGAGGGEAVDPAITGLARAGVCFMDIRSP
jgi:hypothetical protein